MKNAVELVFATANPHKLAEVRTIIRDERIKLKSLKDINWLEDIEETGSTLDENALIKARAIYNSTGMNVFADDTGLEVRHINMGPGVHTARYAGEQRNAEDNMNKLLKALEGASDRTAQFRAVIALIWEGKEYLFEGVVTGQISEMKKGMGGFGYMIPFLFQMATTGVLDN